MSGDDGGGRRTERANVARGRAGFAGEDATYSKPLSAATASLLKIFRPRIDMVAPR